jgi:hypothetical protein
MGFIPDNPMIFLIHFSFSLRVLRSVMPFFKFLDLPIKLRGRVNELHVLEIRRVVNLGFRSRHGRPGEHMHLERTLFAERPSQPSYIPADLRSINDTPGHKSL